MLKAKSQLSLTLGLAAVLLLVGCGAGQAQAPLGDEGEGPLMVEWNQPDSLLGNASDAEPAGPHNKVDGGFLVGDVFIPEEVGGVRIVDVLTSQDTPCVNGAFFTVRALPPEDMEVRRLVADLFAERDGRGVIQNITDQVSDAQVYESNESRIRRDREQGCVRSGWPMRNDSQLIRLEPAADPAE